jgi:hypothetical protein
MTPPIQAPRVLLVHPESQVRVTLAEELREFVVEGVADRADALLTIDQVRPQFVVATHGAARRLLRDLDRHGSEAIPIFICPLTDARAVSELADVAAEGHLFHTLDGSGEWADVARNLRRLLFMRDSTRVALPDPLGVRFLLDGQEFRATCVDVANRGIALHLPIDETVERFWPGVVLSDVAVFRANGTVLLTRPRATVRQVTVDSSRGQPSFRVGLALDPGGEATDGGLVLSDPVRVIALLRRAARRKTPVSLTTAQGARFMASVALPPQDSTADCLVLRTPTGASFVPGEVLEVSIDFGGEAFRGHVSVLQTGSGALAVALPRSLGQIHRRGFLRFQPPAGTPFVVSFQSPVDGTPILRPVLDIHVGGLSFPFDAGREVLPLGLHINDIHLMLPSGEVVKCRGEVRDVRALPGHHPGGNLMLHPFRCGLKLSGVPPRMRTEIVETTMKVRFPGSYRAGHTVPFGSIWELMGEAGQFFPEYPLEMGPHVVKLERVQHALARSEGELARSYVALDEGRPRGFVAGLRAYSRTWLNQHLAVARGYHRQESVSRDLGTLIVEWAESLEDIEYIRYVWRTENRWPNRVFGWIARTMRNSALTRLVYTNYLLLAPGRAMGAAESFRIREGTSADAAWLEQHLRSSGRLVELRSEDLSARELDLSTVGARFSRVGLERRRQVFLVDGEHEPLAVALVERSTPGLCWPELTNSFRVMPIKPEKREHPSSRAAVQALAKWCAGLYRAEGRSTVVGLAPDAHVVDFEAVGFEQCARVADWTFHRSLIRPWHNVFLAVFERLAKRERSGAAVFEEALF